MRAPRTKALPFLGALLLITSCAANGPTAPLGSDRSAVEFAQRVQRSKAFSGDGGSTKLDDQGDHVEYRGDFPVAGSRSYDDQRLGHVRDSFRDYCGHVAGRFDGRVCRSSDGNRILFIAQVDQSKYEVARSNPGFLWVSMLVIEPKAGSSAGEHYLARILDRERQDALAVEQNRREAPLRRAEQAQLAYAMTVKGTRVCSEGMINGDRQIAVIGFVEGKDAGRYQIRVVGTTPINLREFHWGSDGRTYLEGQ